MNEQAKIASIAPLVDVAELIDQQAVGRFQIGVLLLCASAMLVDGFDTQTIGYVAPALSVALAVKPSALGMVFAAQLLPDRQGLLQKWFSVCIVALCTQIHRQVAIY